MRIIDCNTKNCNNKSDQKLTIKYDNNLIIEIELCDDCTKIIEFTEISNSSLSEL